MLPEHCNDISLLQSTNLTVPEVIFILDKIESQLSKDPLTEQFSPFLHIVSDKLKEMRRIAHEVAKEADMNTSHNLKSLLTH